jgi:hypothetical protein
VPELLYKEEIFQLVGKLRVGLLVNFGGDVLEWKRVIL